ncbi:MAG: biotin/lipoyl-containing protein, partial [Candidatus Sulfotelmatobacter sp.]
MIEFKLPALGENIEQGDLVRLMIAPGATVSEGQPVMELETDKAVVEVPSSVSGKVQEILVKEGDKIKVGQVVFTADNNGATAVAEAPRQKEAAPVSSKIEPVQPSAITSAAAKAQPAPSPQSEPQAAPRRARSTDTPAVTEFRLQELGENIS